jgi:hypothetical protein
MLRLLLDENFDNDLISPVRKQYPELDIIRAQDIAIVGAPDPVVLEWAAQESRILFTHDRSTIPPIAYARIAAGLPMPGVVVVSTTASMGRIIDELLAMVGSSFEDEWENQVRYIPL